MNLLKQLDPWVSEELYKRELQRKTGGSMSWPVAARQRWALSSVIMRRAGEGIMGTGGPKGRSGDCPV